jgi:hypothetical protein
MADIIFNETEVLDINIRAQKFVNLSAGNGAGFLCLSVCAVIVIFLL